MKLIESSQGSFYDKGGSVVRGTVIGRVWKDGERDWRSKQEKSFESQQ